MTSILRIKEAATLPLVAGEYVKLRKAGSSLVGLCPFHTERTGSFHVHPEYFKCFGCGAGGDVVTFVSLIEGVSIGRAIRLLSERTGISLDAMTPRTRLQRTYDVQEMAFAEWWHKLQADRLARRTSFFSQAWAEIGEDGDALWLAAEDAGALWRQFVAVPRSGLRALAERCATAEDRRWWNWLQDWPRAMAFGVPISIDSSAELEVSFHA